MKGKSRYIQLFILVVALCSCSGNNKQLTEEPRGANNRAYQWGKISLEATANDTETFRPRPTVTARMLGLVWTAVFDAWSRYDEKARPLYLQQAPLLSHQYLRPNQL